MQHYDLNVYESLSARFRELSEESLSATAMDQLLLCNLCISLECPSWPSLPYVGRRSVPQKNRAFPLEVSAMLAKLGIAHTNDHNINGLEVDIALATRRVVVEAYGPAHFFVGSRKLVGSILFKRRLLLQLGWEVFGVPFYEWGGQSEQQRLRFLTKLMS